MILPCVRSNEWIDLANRAHPVVVEAIGDGAAVLLSLRAVLEYNDISLVLVALHLGIVQILAAVAVGTSR